MINGHRSDSCEDHGLKEGREAGGQLRSGRVEVSRRNGGGPDNRVGDGVEKRRGGGGGAGAHLRRKWIEYRGEKKRGTKAGLSVKTQVAP